HHCADTPRLEEKMGWYERELRSLFDLARSLDPSAGMTVFSDHGMTPVVCRHDLFGEIEPLGFHMPEDYLAVYDSTMARFWFFSDRARAEISAVLRSSICGDILEDEELERLGIRFSDQRYGEVVFLL